MDAVVMGINPDSLKSHQKFKQKYELTYPLLVDEGHKVAAAYGVWNEKSMYGVKFWGVDRTTFIIGRDGRVARVFRKVKIPGHVQEVAEAVAALG